MLLSIAFIMLVSSINIILYTNHLTALNKKEMKRAAIKQKFREPLEIVKAEEADKEVLGEAV